MAGSTAEWERYERWNAAIADVVYPRQVTGVPAYLDLEDDILVAIRDAAEPGATEPEQALIDVVKGTLVFKDGPATLFRGHLNRLRRWQTTGMTEPPPTLGLLALMSLTAERMHEGEGKASHNYYGRLAELLDLDEGEKDWFAQGYHRKHDGEALSQTLWSSLNDWLETLEGTRGIPTAYPVGHAHIGLPMSQALVREADRVKFGDMFASYGLPPHTTYPAVEMENLLSEWMSRVPCPASKTLAAIWNKDVDAKERIIAVARLTLEAWDGTVTAGQLQGSKAPLVDAVRARATVRSFPRKSIDISIVVPAKVDAADETVDVLDEHEKTIVTLDLVPIASGWMTVADPDDVDVASFLDGITCLRREGQALPLRRRSRRLVPMRWDDLLQSFIEAERVLLGEDCLLIVRDDIVDRVREMLSQIARPGYVEQSAPEGIPSGWSTFEQVQILSSVPPEMLSGKLVDLNLLQPIATTQVVLQGGMKLPGNVPKWSSGMPPELRASTDGTKGLWASIVCTRKLALPRPLPREHRSAYPVLIWDLAAEHLPDGDYDVLVLEANGEQVAKAQQLRLRSADNPGVLLDPDQRPISHDEASQLFGFAATRSGHDDSFVCVPTLATEVSEVPSAPEVPAWYVARLAAPRHAKRAPSVVMPQGDPSSCMVTGSHYMDVEQWQRGIKSFQGVCRHCGLIKRFPVSIRKKKQKRSAKASSASAPRINVDDLEPVRESSQVDWEAGFDALCHVGSGPMSWLERIAMQMDPSGLFTDAFARRLESLGHVEIERDPRTLRERSWDLVDPTLIGGTDGRWVLTGFRSERVMAALEDALWRSGGELIIDADVDAPPLVCMSGLDDAGLRAVMQAIEESCRRPARAVPNAAWALASHLKPLSHVVKSLPVITTIGARSYERWNPKTARFEDVDGASSVGAYRLSSFQRTYVYRRAEDLGEMQALLGDARIVKYAAALDAGEEMIGYDADERVLYVPLGADLPGLYGRAVVLASGYAPVSNEKERLLEYCDVPPDLAGYLAGLLMT